MRAPELFDLTGKRALVTGGGRGIGRHIAVGLAEAGAEVVVASRKLAACEAVAHADSETLAGLCKNDVVWHVTGRGPLPPVRVGNQPYGVLLTSDQSRWKYPERRAEDFALVSMFDELTPYLTDLHRILGALERSWSNLASDLPSENLISPHGLFVENF